MEKKRKHERLRIARNMMGMFSGVCLVYESWLMSLMSPNGLSIIKSNSGCQIKKSNPLQRITTELQYMLFWAISDSRFSTVLTPDRVSHCEENATFLSIPTVVSGGWFP